MENRSEERTGPVPMGKRAGEAGGVVRAISPKEREFQTWWLGVDGVFFLAFFLCAFVWLRYHPLAEYTLADTLLNYRQGFYRRALLGNIFLFIPGSLSVFTVLKIFYGGCLACFFVLGVQTMWKGSTIAGRFFLYAAILFLPFGISFYLKDVPGIRKELFFVPLLVLFGFSCSPGRRGGNLVAAGVTVIGCLVHESYVFLALPFILSVLWLDGQVTKRGLIGQLLFAGAVNVAILMLSVGPAEPIRAAADACVALGIKFSDLENFVSYNSLSPANNIIKSLEHLGNPNVLIYAGLFVSQCALLIRIPSFFGYRVQIADCRKLFVCLVGLAVSTVALVCIATDYGRWLSFSFIAVCLLVSHQFRGAVFSPELRRPKLAVVGIAAVCFLALFVRVPHWTDQAVQANDWMHIRLAGPHPL